MRLSREINAEQQTMYQKSLLLCCKIRDRIQYTTTCCILSLGYIIIDFSL